MRGEAPLQFVGLGLFGQLDLHDLIETRDAQTEGRRETETGLGMKALAHAELKSRAPQGALEQAQQVAVADQPQISLLAETNTKT
jgi:hypothetical protein